MVLALLLIGAFMLAFNVRFVRATTAPMMSILNPGPTSYPSAWNASSTVRYVGTPDFDFYSNETSLGSTFFMNITVSNVTNLEAWFVGLVYDNATLQYVSTWLPTDNVFAPLTGLDVPIVNTDVVIAPVNASYQEIEWGAGYIMPTPSWDFNGTGTLAQVEFQIIAQVNSTNPQVSSSFAFDPAWTEVFYWPNGSDIPTLNAGNFIYELPPFHEVVVTNITASSMWVYQGWTANVNVTVFDDGDFPENATVTLYYNITAGDVAGTQTVALASGENATLMFAWNTTGVPINYDNYTLTTVATILTGSNTLSDGAIQIRIVGDINGDGKVDMSDIMTIVSAFGSYPGNPRWNLDCDLNQVGRVDLSDVVTALMNFGKSA